MTIQNLTVNKSGGVAALQSTLNVTGIINLTAGTLNSGVGYLRINLNTGSIAYNGSDAGQITGNIIVHKSLKGNRVNYLSSPLSSVSFSDLATTNGANVINSAYIYEWDENGRTAGNRNSGWKLISGNFTNNGLGYSAFANTAGTIDLTGTYSHSSDVTVNLSYTPIEPLADDNGWNLIGNPFPSVVNWNAVTLPPLSAMDREVHFYNGASRTYTSYSYDGFPNNTNLDIPPFQAFFVHALEPTSITFPRSARNTRTKSLYRTANPYDYALKLSVNSGDYSDVTYLRLKDEASLGFDGELDAHKLKNADKFPSLYTQFGSILYSINSIPFNLQDLVIPLQFEPMFTGTYTLKAGSMGSFFNEYEFILEDRKLGTYQNLLADSVYTFSVSSLEDGMDRFFINLRGATITGSTGASSGKLKPVSIRAYEDNIILDFKNNSNNNSASVSVFNMLGQEVEIYEQINTNGKQVIKFAPDQNGVYIVKVTLGESVYSEKVYLSK